MKALPKFMWLNSDKLVATAWKDAIAGKAISVPGWQYRILTFVMRNAPRQLIRKIGMNVRIKQRKN
jgi:short-subunit dehydrogenase